MPSRKRIQLAADKFSSQAEGVLRALREANSEDAGVERLAKRAAQAITRFEGGLCHKDRPLGAFLLFGQASTDLRECAKVLAEAWIGTRDGGAQSYTYIDCAGLHGHGNGSTDLTSLIGPPRIQPNYPIAILPRLSDDSVAHPDFIIRQGKKECAFLEFKQRFLEKHRVLFDQFEGLSAQIAKRLQEEHIQIIDEGKPYRSIIVFDNLEFAPPDLVSSIIRPILHPARLQILNLQGLETSRFNAGIVILLMHDAWDYLPAQNDLGFKTPSKEGSGGAYQKIRRELLRDPNFAGLMQDIGDNLILLGPKTEAQQKNKFVEQLKGFADKLHVRHDIKVAWSEAFVQMLVKESLDPAVGYFTRRRTESAFEKYVEFLLACAVTQHSLRAGCTVTFGIKENHAFVPHCSIQNGSVEVITCDQIRQTMEEDTQTEELPQDETEKFPFIEKLEKDLLKITTAFIQKTSPPEPPAQN